MKVTVDIDESLLKEAGRLTGILDVNALVSAGLRALVERESAARLASLGGSEPQLRSIPRRRSIE
ncbi:MAG: type II toxin-antitoxin system VapB family antitoxin [Dehalococcoidia bacterium]|nr:type II toxin-antitoxin system VapB family antitoxin [Dehalococcoidia bacterium]MYD51975.1 type II toxin-antitoxin system VapB family antitoxin [Dehalococcoidia bacterium]